MTRDELEAIIRRHQAELYRYIRYLGATDATTAEDVVQDMFVAAWKSDSPPSLSNNRRMAAWLRGIGRNIFLMHCRKHRTSPILVDSEWLERAETCWDAEGLGGEGADVHRDALRLCLEKLSDREQQVLDYRYAERIGRGEMARRLNMTDNGVKSLLQRLRRNLAACIRRRINRESNR